MVYSLKPAITIASAACTGKRTGPVSLCRYKWLLFSSDQLKDIFYSQFKHKHTYLIINGSEGRAWSKRKHKILTISWSTPYGASQYTVLCLYLSMFMLCFFFFLNFILVLWLHCRSLTSWRQSLVFPVPFGVAADKQRLRLTRGSYYQWERCCSLCKAWLRFPAFFSKEGRSFCALQ